MAQIFAPFKNNAYLCVVIKKTTNRLAQVVKPRINTMTTYSVSFCDKANSSEMARFDNLEKAQAYVESEIEGRELIKEGVDPYTDSAWICWYEICAWDENGEPTDEAYSSKCFYN